MVAEVLHRAVVKIGEMPVADQERIGATLDAYVDELNELREKLDAGIRSLDAGLGRNVDIEQVIARARASS